MTGQGGAPPSAPASRSPRRGGGGPPWIVLLSGVAFLYVAIAAGAAARSRPAPAGATATAEGARAGAAQPAPASAGAGPGGAAPAGPAAQATAPRPIPAGVTLRADPGVVPVGRQSRLILTITTRGGRPLQGARIPVDGPWEAVVVRSAWPPTTRWDAATHTATREALLPGGGRATFALALSAAAPGQYAFRFRVAEVGTGLPVVTVGGTEAPVEVTGTLTVAP